MVEFRVVGGSGCWVGGRKEEDELEKKKKNIETEIDGDDTLREMN